MRLIYFIMLGIIITSTNLTVYSYDEEDVSYFLKNSKCHQCDLSNYNFEKIGGTNFTNFWKKKDRSSEDKITYSKSSPFYVLKKLL